MRKPACAIRRRAAVLTYLTIVDLLYALSLAKPAPEAARSSTTHFLASVMPLQAWGALWLVVGLLCLAGALSRRFERVAFSAATGIKVLWGGTFLLGWLIGDIDRGWVAAVIWLGLAALVMVLAGIPESVTITDRHEQ